MAQTTCNPAGRRRSAAWPGRGTWRTAPANFALAFVALLAGCAAPPGAHSPQPADYRVAQVPEAQRRVLPAAVRNQLPPEVRDAVELNVLVRSSLPAQARLLLRWRNEVALANGMLHQWVTALECAPLPAGYLQCLELASANGGGAQSIHVQGGLLTVAHLVLPSVQAPAGAPDGFNAYALRARQDGPLPAQGIDLVSVLYRPGASDPATLWVRCRSSGPVDPPPPLRPLGPVEKLRCDSQELDARSWAPLQPAVATSYYWLQRGHVALPTVLFERNPNKADFAGHVGIWRLLDFATQVEDVRIQPLP